MKRKKIRICALLCGMALLSGSRGALAAEKEEASWFSTIARRYGLLRSNVSPSVSDRQTRSAVPVGLLLKNSHQQESGSEALPGIWPTGLSLRSSFDSVSTAPPEKGSGHYRVTSGAGLGDYYAVSQVDYGKVGLTGATGQPDLQVSLDAGTRRNALNTGLTYTYRGAGYQAGSRTGVATDPGPFFLLTPLRKGEGGPAVSSTAGAQAVFFYAGYDLNTHLNVGGSVGFAKVKEEGASGFDLTQNSRRWGIDLAARYKLLDNLVYETHLGYVNIDSSGSTPTAPFTVITPTDPGSQDIYQLNNQIRMTF